MSSAETYDILVIGSGESGKYLAWTMAGEGHRTAVVERKLIGGSCPNIACLPSKNIIASAKVRSFTRRAAEFGVDLESAATNMRGVRDRKRAMVDSLIEVHLGRYRASGAELIMGEAHFSGERTVDVELNDGGWRKLRGERVFLNLGTRATMPDVPGLAAARPMTHVELLDLDRLPEHLIVIGGGYVGLELSQAMRRFGARVTVIESGPQPLGHEDPDVTAGIVELFGDEGITLHRQTSVRSVDGESGRSVRLVAEGPDGELTIEGTDLLVAVGRTPNTGGIGLEQAGVRLTETGYIAVDEHLATTAADVWAMGDCAGSPQFTHVAFDDFQVVHDNLTGGSRSTRGRLVPFCMYTDPELARIGLNETEARRLGLGYRVLSMPMAAVLRTRTISEPRGFMKMLIGADSDEILGFTAFGAEATELLAAVQTAMVGRLPYTTLRSAIYTHPSMAEGLTFLLRNTPAPRTSPRIDTLNAPTVGSSMAAEITEADLAHLRRCVELAAEAVAAGDFPFGSVLVSADGTVVAEDRNREKTEGDPTGHPELALARWAALHMTPPERAEATVYTSGEHCPMCAAAHGWVGLGRIVYATSSEQMTGWLAEMGVGPSPVLPLAITEVVPGLPVAGPAPQLAAEVRELHRRFRSARL